MQPGRVARPALVVLQDLREQEQQGHQGLADPAVRLVQVVQDPLVLQGRLALREQGL